MDIIFSQGIGAFERTAFFFFFGGRSKTKLLLEMDFEVFRGHVKMILQFRTKVSFLPKIHKNPLSDLKKRGIFDILSSCYVFLLVWCKNANCDLPS